MNPQKLTLSSSNCLLIKCLASAPASNLTEQFCFGHVPFRQLCCKSRRGERERSVPVCSSTAVLPTKGKLAGKAENEDDEDEEVTPAGLKSSGAACVSQKSPQTPRRLIPSRYVSGGLKGADQRFEQRLSKGQVCKWHVWHNRHHANPSRQYHFKPSSSDHRSRRKGDTSSERSVLHPGHLGGGIGSHKTKPHNKLAQP